MDADGVDAALDHVVHQADLVFIAVGSLRGKQQRFKADVLRRLGKTIQNAVHERIGIVFYDHGDGIFFVGPHVRGRVPGKALDGIFNAFRAHGCGIVERYAFRHGQARNHRQHQCQYNNE